MIKLKWMMGHDPRVEVDMLGTIIILVVSIVIFTWAWYVKREIDRVRDARRQQDERRLDLDRIEQEQHLLRLAASYIERYQNR